MRYLASLSVLALLAGFTAANAQTATNMQALQGLVPFSALNNSPEGKVVLARNYSTTGAIQTGAAAQPGLQPFAAQQAQAVRDAFITAGNATELADGLGTKLGAAYQARAVYTQGAGKPSFTSISPDIAALFAYTAKLAEVDSGTAKFFFANGTVNKSGQAASTAAMALMQSVGGATNVLGTAYGSQGADPLGNPRPFQTEMNLATFAAPDYFGNPSGNAAWLTGPAADLTKSPAFPSGHTVYGYTEATLLAIMVPERFTQEITRGAEYGNSRIILGAHYAVDVIAGRSLAWYDLAQLLAENRAYLNQKEGKTAPIGNYAVALKLAQGELRQVLEAGTGEGIAQAAAQDDSRFANGAANEAFYESTQTYGLPAAYPAEAAKPEDVWRKAPEAGYLLTAAFPYLSLKQADRILTATEGPGGGFLDNGSHFGVYSRLDLYKAGLAAKALAPKG
jgi:membrane-associated phospholipid phosphatase